MHRYNSGSSLELGFFPYDAQVSFIRGLMNRKKNPQQPIPKEKLRKNSESLGNFCSRALKNNNTRTSGYLKAKYKEF